MHTTIFDKSYTARPASVAMLTLQSSHADEAAAEPRNWQRVIDEIGERLCSADIEEQARLYHRLGYVALYLGDTRTKAMEAFSLLLERAERLEDCALQTMAHIGLSAVCDTLGQRYPGKLLACQRPVSRFADDIPSAACFRISEASIL